jgi:hypothetical protein
MSVQMYGTAIHNAIKTGDRSKMEATLAQAKEVFAEQGDLKAAIAELEEALKKIK